MHVLRTCKNEDDQIKNEGARVFTRFLPLYGDISRRSRAANSAVLGSIWPNFELVRDIMDVLLTCKYEEDLIKIEGTRVFTTFSPLQPYGSYLLPWKPEFQSYLVQNLIQSIPHPNDASDKIWLRLRRYSSLKMFTDTQTDTQTTARLVYYKLTNEPSPQVS